MSHIIYIILGWTSPVFLINRSQLSGLLAQTWIDNLTPIRWPYVWTELDKFWFTKWWVLWVQWKRPGDNREYKPDLDKWTGRTICLFYAVAVKLNLCHGLLMADYWRAYTQLTLALHALSLIVTCVGDVSYTCFRILCSWAKGSWRKDHKDRRACVELHLVARVPVSLWGFGASRPQECPTRLSNKRIK